MSSTSCSRRFHLNSHILGGVQTTKQKCHLSIIGQKHYLPGCYLSWVFSSLLHTWVSLTSSLRSIWVSYYCCNKSLQTYYFKTIQICDLKVMAVRKSYPSHRVKLMCQQNSVLYGGSREPCSFQLLEALHVPGLLASSLRFLIFTSPSLMLTLQPLS